MNSHPSAPGKTILIVDDELAITQSLKRVLRKSGANIECYTCPQQAISRMKQGDVDLVISDYKMPGISGIELLRQCKEIKPDCTTLMVSAFRDFDAVAAAFNQGIVDQFMAKPWDNNELLHSVMHRLSIGTTPVTTEISADSFHGMHSASANMHYLFKQIERAACANAPIFIHGETGTGKELVAKACHAQSYAQAQPFIAVNCANFNENLIESQLFGSKKGAFTGATQQQGLFAAAAKGTLFLDEITTLDLSLQAKLLRVLQEREYSPLGSHELIKFEANIITASSTSLTEAVKLGQFREDLYYRLFVIGLVLPPLREREADVQLLTTLFLHRFNRQHGLNLQLSPEAMALLQAYSWPGNVRQLENLMQSLVAMCPTQLADVDYIQKLLDERAEISVTTSSAVLQPTPPNGNSTAILPLWLVEKHAIEAAIKACGGNIAKAAALLQVSPSTLYRKMQSWKSNTRA